MKNKFLKKIFAFTLVSTATLLGQAAPPEALANSSTKEKTVVGDKPVPKSSFSVPAKPADGHDPFFPMSDRLFATKTAPKQTPTTAGASLVFNGLSGTSEHRLAMINGYTFAEGEEASVNTSTGRQRVRLVELKGQLAVVEVAGERRELHFQDH